MSLKGVDAQIMVTRTNDMTRDAETLRRAGELQQTQVEHNAKAEEERNMQTVVKSEKSERPDLEPGEGGDGTGDFHLAREHRDDEAEFNGEDMMIPAAKEQKILDVLI